MHKVCLVVLLLNSEIMPESTIHGMRVPKQVVHLARRVVVRERNTSWTVAFKWITRRSLKHKALPEARIRGPPKVMFTITSYQGQSGRAGSG